MKDRCKLFCRVAGTMAYYQLKDRVVDGTPCGPDTYDICVQGLCRVDLHIYFLAVTAHCKTWIHKLKSMSEVLCCSCREASVCKLKVCLHPVGCNLSNFLVNHFSVAIINKATLNRVLWQIFHRRFLQNFDSLTLILDNSDISLHSTAFKYIFTHCTWHDNVWEIWL